MGPHRRRGSLLDTVELDLPAAPTAPRLAHAVLRGTLEQWQLEPLLDVAALLTSELVTNVVRHVGGPMTLRVSPAASALRVEVDDRSPESPAVEHDPPAVGARPRRVPRRRDGERLGQRAHRRRQDGLVRARDPERGGRGTRRLTAADRSAVDPFPETGELQGPAHEGAGSSQHELAVVGRRDGAAAPPAPRCRSSRGT